MEQSEVQAVGSGVGDDLRKAREAAGMTRGDIAAQTKIAERHIVSIEEGRFADLAGRTYAVGFARAYARNVGLDEGTIAERVKREMSAQEPREVRMPSTFEPGDPARVPPKMLAWIAGAVGVVVLGTLGVFWSGLLSPEAQMPDLLSDAPAVPAPRPGPVAPAQAAAQTGPVSITATQDGIWIQVSDAAGTRLVTRALKNGESWAVPAGVQGATLRTGRPDALAIRVGSRVLPPLADKPVTMGNVSLAPQDLLARANGVPAPTPSASAAPASAASTQVASTAPATAPARHRPASGSAAAPVSPAPAAPAPDAAAAPAPPVSTETP